MSENKGKKNMPEASSRERKRVQESSRERERVCVFKS
jgi:hypothetical protein